MNNIDSKNQDPYLGLPLSPKKEEKEATGIDQAEIFKNLKAQALRREPVKLKSIKALTDEKLRYKLGKVIGNVFKEPIDIEKYEITDPKIALQVARYNADCFPRDFSSEIQSYKLDSTQRFEFAKQIAKVKDSYIALFIDRYDLDSKQRFEVAKILASVKDSHIAMDIRRFDLDLDQRFEVAKIAARVTGSGLPDYMRDEELDPLRYYKLNPEQLAEVRALVNSFKDEEIESDRDYESDKEEKSYNSRGERPYDSIDDSITPYASDEDSDHEYTPRKGYDDSLPYDSDKDDYSDHDYVPNDLDDAITSHDSEKEDYSDHYNEFKTPFEEAKHIAKNTFHTINIKNFKLNTDQRFEIAKIIAARERSDISRYIKDYELNSDQRFAIAKIVASKKDSNIDKYIKDYELNTEQRFEVAKIAVMESSNFISHSIKKYELDSQQRFEIAKMSIVVNPFWTSKFIENFDLNTKQRFEVAKLAARDLDSDIVALIKHYKLKNPEQRFEVAKIAAKAGHNIFEDLDDFEIRDYEQVVELANLSNPENMRMVLTYPFEVEDYRKILLLSALVNKDLAISKEAIKRADSRWPLLIKKLNKVPVAEHSVKKQKKAREKLIALENELKGNVRDRYNEQPKTCERMLTWIESSCKSDNLLVRQRLLSWTTSIVGLCNEQDLSFEEYEFLFPILENLANFPDPTVRGKLSFKLMTCFLGEKNANLREWQKQLVGNQTRNQRPVVAMLLSPLASAGEEEAALRFIDTFYTNKQLSASGTSQRTVIDLLMNLNQKLSSKEQASLLTKLVAEVVPPTKTLPPIAQGLPSKERKEALKERARQQQLPNRTFTEMLNSAQIANDLLLLGKGDSLKRIATRQDIDTLMEDSYQTVLGGEMSDTFTANYLNSFGKFRDKQAIWTYYANLQNLSGFEKDEALFWFKIYMQSVLDGTFKERRYENDHLDTVFELWPSLKDSWKEGGISGIGDLATTDPAPAKDIVSQLYSNFKEAILRHKHLGKGASQNYPYLVEFLENPENRENVLKEIEEERKGLLKQEKTDKQKNKALFAKLRFQKCLLDMFEPQANLERHLAEAVRIAPESEFKNDLKGALHLLEAPAVNAQSLIAVDTDDPCDFLLMGTEVEESCQRIDGTPELNRGLIGTALNGQTRMIAVKSEGKILARALMRLLWDKEGKNPVLFLEPIYTSSADPKIEQIVIEMAKKRAKQLDLPLLTEYQDKPSRYPHKLYSLDGQCPFEYVDALSVAGEVVSPTFSIKKSSFIT